MTPSRLMRAALARPDVSDVLSRHSQYAVVAAGKAAADMFDGWNLTFAHRTSGAVVTAPPRADWSAGVRTFAASHPMPNVESEAAARAALALASSMSPDQGLVLLISGGASSMLALPRHGVLLADKADVSRRLMRAGADIRDLNVVRTTLSAIKGGGLLRAASGRVLTLAISDVCGVAEDDPAVIGSGPGVSGRASNAAARDALRRAGVWDAVATRVRALLERDEPGHAPEAAPAVVIGSRRDAMAGAAEAASSLGYRVIVKRDAVTGDARMAAAAWCDTMLAATRECVPTPVCFISSGETTMHVVGGGRGGRNQEFALAVALRLDDGRPIAVASIGTDGVDGSSGAAGAIVDQGTRARIARAGIDVAEVLRRNDSAALFEALGDAFVCGQTGTNTGDIQIAVSR